MEYIEGDSERIPVTLPKEWNDGHRWRIGLDNAMAVLEAVHVAATLVLQGVQITLNMTIGCERVAARWCLENWRGYTRLLALL